MKPGGGLFFVDPNQSGGASSLHLAEVRWGRLVDVHEIGANGRRVETPVYQDMVVEPSLAVSPSYVLDRHPVTQRERLTIQARKTGVPDSSTFDELLADAKDALPLVSVKSDAPNAAPPFTTVPRNGCVVLRFDDCLDDDATAAQNLGETVRILTGYPPTTNFVGRLLFDPNHGAVVGGEFHSTRVLVDPSVAEAESTPSVEANLVGLPASDPNSSAANLSIRVPSQRDIGTGQTVVLTNLSGVALDSDDNGPVDEDSPTFDVVRAMRSGNPTEDSNGFLSESLKPRVLGTWTASVLDADPDPAGDAGFDFLVDFSFSSICLRDPSIGDVIQVGDSFLQATAPGVVVGNTVTDLAMRSVSFLANPLTLIGNAFYETPFDNTLPLVAGCWVRFLPEPPVFGGGVTTLTQVRVRFSEPMDPATLSPFKEFMVVAGAGLGSSSATAHNIIVGEVGADPSLTGFSFTPSRPYPHVVNLEEILHLELDGAKDLAGNSLLNDLPFVDFTIAPLEEQDLNGAIVLRFESNDETGPNGTGADTRRDLRGQFFYGPEGSIFPRSVSLTGWPVDRNNPVPSLMTALGNGVFTPLVPLGAKMQTLWRYCDLGWDVLDETKYNLDVIGLSWSPIGGLVVADFYDLFEIRLGHSVLLPDEPRASSGLPGSPMPFDGNFLPGSNPKVVHQSTLGYTINPANLFNSTSGTAMMPYPVNRGLTPDVTYTWRDTTLEGRGGGGDPAQRGIPLEIEGVAMVNTVPVGSVAGVGQVPSFGLPLLMEFKCYPANQGLGSNRFDVSITSVLAPLPGFRAFSAGGNDTFGRPQVVQPDLELIPSGGFNPGGNPPGSRTANSADNTFYIGQLDTVVRVSRVHSIWLDAGQPISPEWDNPVLEPIPDNQPTGTGVLLDFRATNGFANAGTEPFDASELDPYGNQTANLPQSPTDWSDSISVADGRRFVQVRLTFVNNISSGLHAELTALALPFRF